MTRLLLVTLLAEMLPLFAGSAPPPLADLKALAFAEEPGRAKALFDSTAPQGGTMDEQWLEAMSWVGRAGAIGGDWNLAAEYSLRTMQGCERLLETRTLDADSGAPLPVALGAAIETMSKFYVAKNDPGQAVAFLREHLGKYAGTSIVTRLNKNLLLLDLEGKPMPELNLAESLNAHRSANGNLDGHVTLFFFWAHWCEDCAAQRPILRLLLERFGNRGLRVIAPTRLYGYLKRGEDASPGEEKAYVIASYVDKDPLLSAVPVPLTSDAFVSFGVSTTPTLVLVDRTGVVRMYHPGMMEEPDLASRIEALL